MSNSIIGTGTVGLTLARIFADAGIDAQIANTRGAETINLDAKQHNHITPVALDLALEADTIILALPYKNVEALGKVLPSWESKVVIDVTNAFGWDPSTFEGGSSTDLVVGWLPGATVVKAFNHLPFRVYDTPIPGTGGKRATFVTSDDAAASATVAGLAGQLGFSPVELGALSVGGPLLALGGPLLFKQLVDFPG